MTARTTVPQNHSATVARFPSAQSRREKYAERINKVKYAGTGQLTCTLAKKLVKIVSERKTIRSRREI